MSYPTAQPSAPESTGSEVSTAETLTAIFFEPSKAFEALRDKPRFLVAGLILLALTLLVTVILYTRVDMGQYIRDKMERSPNAAQQTEAQKEMGVKMGKTIGMVAVPLSVPVTIAIGGALYLLAAMAFGGSMTYSKGVSVWTYSSLPPAVLGTLVAIMVLFLKSADSVDPEHLMVTNPGALTNAESSPILVALLSQFDLLRFYGMFLAAIGLRKVGKLSSGASWSIVIGLWIIGAILRIGSAAIFNR